MRQFLRENSGNQVACDRCGTPVIPFPLVETAPGDWWPDLGDYFCWDSAGDRVAYVNAARNELWLADLLNTHARIYTGAADTPQWSPDSSLIAFRSGYGVSTIKPDARGFKTIIPNTSTWLFAWPHFSPSGSYIVYTGFYQPDSNFDVFRATSTGGSRVNLTSTPYPQNESTHPGSGAGWR